MTLIEAARLIGTTPDNLRGAIKRGSLKAAKHGRDWWVDPKEVERYRRENRREQAVAFLDERLAHFHSCRECYDDGWVGACGWNDPKPPHRSWKSVSAT